MPKSYLSFNGTGDFELGSEPIVFVSMTFYSKRAVILTVFMEAPRGEDALEHVESCKDALEPMMTRAKMHSSLC